MSNVTRTGEWTVDELAHDHGLPVSTVRLYQTRGLLPPPRKEGRVGYYDDEHRRRLRLITELQERGFSLASIKELVDGMAAGQSLQTVLGLGDAPTTWTREEPATLSLAELVEHLPGVEPTPDVIDRVARLGLIRLAADGTVTVDSPAFLDIGSRLMKMGVPSETVLDEYEHLRTLTDDIAARFTEVFRRHFWEAFEAQGPARGQDPRGRRRPRPARAARRSGGPGRAPPLAPGRCRGLPRRAGRTPRRGHPAPGSAT